MILGRQVERILCPAIPEPASVDELRPHQGSWTPAGSVRGSCLRFSSATIRPAEPTGLGRTFFCLMDSLWRAPVFLLGFFSLEHCLF